jgi:hypothetical protein
LGEEERDRIFDYEEEEHGEIDGYYIIGWVTSRRLMVPLVVPLGKRKRTDRRMSFN